MAQGEIGFWIIGSQQVNSKILFGITLPLFTEA